MKNEPAEPVDSHDLAGGPARGEEGFTPLWSASRTLLRRHGAEFFSRWEKVARDFLADDVHDLRVASRRLREGLGLFSPCLPGKRTAKLLKRVKKVTCMLGELRNTDEAHLFFSSLSPQETAASDRELQFLLANLRQEAKEARKRLGKELGSLDPAPLQSAFVRLLNRPDLFETGAVDPFMSAKLFAGTALGERARTLEELLPEALREEDAAAQHQLRIAFKKMRYRLEILAPLIKSGYDELRGALKGYQDALGKLHDIDVFCELVRDRLPDGSGRKELLGVLVRRRALQYAEFKVLVDSYPIHSLALKVRSSL